MEKKYLAITSNTGLNFIKRDEIMYCLSDGAYTQIHLESGRKITISKNLKEVENTLSDPQFVRIHNSHVINLNYAVGYINNGHNCVQLSNGEELAVARNRKKDLIDSFTKL